MRKYPVALSKCDECGHWQCSVLCPACNKLFHAWKVAAAWMEELDAGDEDESVIEGLELECSECGWQGLVDEFQREYEAIRYFEIDDEL